MSDEPKAGEPKAGEPKARALAKRLGVDVCVLRNGIHYQARIGVRPAGPIVAPIIDSDTEADAWAEAALFLGTIRRIPSAGELAALEEERDEAVARVRVTEARVAELEAKLSRAEAVLLDCAVAAHDHQRQDACRLAARYLDDRVVHTPGEEGADHETE